ncbi:unnamed protein product [Pseudo-nitzschia multistriata]|uniref:Uncharacterized protein n=1 Tax=Pseudo-nitzschia multistriata TaxID=183589 RepID=A0A448ZF90_9STRA|nr:unnamed protein product [Pseudo-nitzschia multistriata]
MGCSQSKNSSAVVEQAQYMYVEHANQQGAQQHRRNISTGTLTTTTSRQDSLSKWKKDLAESGNLTKAIVKIETSPTKRVEDVYDGVHNGHTLGEGAEGVVRRCTHRETGVQFAAKCLNIGLIEDEKIIETLREEIFIMCQSDHPDIIRLEEVYESEDQIYLIMNLLTGGDMFDRLEEQSDYHYSEHRCANIVKQMIRSVRYLHANKVIHRDLKLENFLFDDPESDNIRLIDFGLSKHFDHDGCKMKDVVGTPYTAAPEMILGEYDEKVDVWAIGVITYLLLCGDPPFGGMDGEALSEVRDNILDCNLLFEPKYIWDTVSDEAKNFIRRLLTKNPAQRPSAFEAAHDEWLISSAKADPLHSKPLNTNLIKNLMDFKEYSDLQKILLEIVSFTLVPEQIKGLKQEFEKIDKDGSGDISLDELKEVMKSRVVTESAGSLTEEEIETIFDSLLLNTKETTIHWHEFIAAGLSRCDFDDRNLRLAFNRMDSDGKGYITLSDLKELVCSKEGVMDDEVCTMWKDGLETVECKQQDRITFDDFKHFFTGHDRSKREIMGDLRSSGTLRNYSHSANPRLVNNRMSSARILTATLGFETYEDEDDEEDESGKRSSVFLVPTGKQMRRRSSAILVKSRTSIMPPEE